MRNASKKYVTKIFKHLYPILQFQIQFNHSNNLNFLTYFHVISNFRLYLRLISSRSRVTSPANGELVSSSTNKEKKDGHKKL